jgi:hypothetical protein
MRVDGDGPFTHAMPEWGACLSDGEHRPPGREIGGSACVNR